MFHWWRKRSPAANAAMPMPFIVGAPRSGTTLLRFMLDSHSEVAVPPETGFLIPCSKLAVQGSELRKALIDTIVNFPQGAPAWSDYQIPVDQFRAKIAALRPLSPASAVRAFYELYAARFGKRRWGDKTPLYCLHLRAIENLLPEARFIHLIRDGRDSALSLRHLWFSPGNDIATLAAYWRDAVQAARDQGTGCPHYLEIRYEDLVLRTEESLRRICDFLDLTFEPAMLRYHERSPERLEEHRERVRTDGQLLVSRQQRLAQQQRTTLPPDAARVFAWKEAMSQPEQADFLRVAGDLLRNLGYEA